MSHYKKMSYSDNKIVTDSKIVVTKKVCNDSFPPLALFVTIFFVTIANFFFNVCSLNKAY